MIDPIIQQARIVIEYQRQEHALAIRKALRTEPHKRAWLTRKGGAA